MKFLWSSVLGAWCFSLSVFADTPVDASKLPAAATQNINFDRDIRPIFQQSCYKCHGTEKPKSKFTLADGDAALAGGKHGVDIIPGNSAKSPLIHYVAGLVDDMEMPPPGRGTPLSPEQISLLRAWIDQGAAMPSSKRSQVEFSLSPTVRWTTVHGDKRAFREQFWRRDGFAGGAENFSLQQKKGDTTVSLDGHYLSDANDFALKLEARKNDVGFVRGGMEQFQKFFDDSGGLAPAVTANSLSLNRNLALTVGRAWFDVGLTLPDRPQIVLGYEYQVRQGNEATLQWGGVTTDPQNMAGDNTKNIFPAFKHIDENTHILKLDASYDIGGWQLSDSARVEFSRIVTSRQNVLVDSSGPQPDQVTRVNEGYQHTSGANTFHIDKRFNDWLFVSGGYLFSRINGDASFNQQTTTGAGLPTFGNQWSANEILLDRQTHSGSVASLLGPWQGLSLSSGVQAEWTRQRGLGDVNFATGDPSAGPITPVPAMITGNLDDASLRENFSLRFNSIPYTTVFAEARLQQESLSRFEQETGGFEPFVRDTDADIDGKEYRVGFDSSPLARLSFGAHYRHSDKQTDYRQVRQFNAGGHPYPGFLLAREMETDQVEPRLVFRATSWLRTTLSYKVEATDFHDATEAVPVLTPGGPIFSGNYDAHTVSFNAALTPMQRLFLSSTFSYSNTRTKTFQNGANYLSAWSGNVYSVISSATFALDEKTDLSASHIFSCADYGQNNTSGLPAGIIYDRHVVQAGISHRWTKNVSTKLQYAFYLYREPSGGGMNDFTAHSVFAAMSFSWP